MKKAKDILLEDALKTAIESERKIRKYKKLIYMLILLNIYQLIQAVFCLLLLT